ncbi:hypothetical protein [Variovorax sp. DXTD-1]|uniref:hypothetical protein n=1 Tax=Variovorax sp. DXTD-1 TaxID=2495592 RepID=UPI0021B07F71|nr:hypothetical protein [Variovorax sp. DXTD-1]
MCRLGLMFCMNPAAALPAAFKVLRPSGRFVALVFGDPANNPCRCLRRLRSKFGFTDHGILAPLDAKAKESAWREMKEALQHIRGDQGWLGPNELLLGSTTRAG